MCVRCSGQPCHELFVKDPDPALNAEINADPRGHISPPYRSGRPISSSPASGYPHQSLAPHGSHGDVSAARRGANITLLRERQMHRVGHGLLELGTGAVLSASRN
jgi:hypothetical protein